MFTECRNLLQVLTSCGCCATSLPPVLTFSLKNGERWWAARQDVKRPSFTLWLPPAASSQLNFTVQLPLPAWQAIVWNNFWKVTQQFCQCGVDSGEFWQSPVTTVERVAPPPPPPQLLLCCLTVDGTMVTHLPTRFPGELMTNVKATSSATTRPTYGLTTSWAR